MAYRFLNDLEELFSCCNTKDLCYRCNAKYCKEIVIYYVDQKFFSSNSYRSYLANEAVVGQADVLVVNKDSPGHQALPLRDLSEEVYPALPPAAAHQNTHWRQALQMQNPRYKKNRMFCILYTTEPHSARRIFHSQLFYQTKSL